MLILSFLIIRIGISIEFYLCYDLLYLLGLNLLAILFRFKKLKDSP